MSLSWPAIFGYAAAVFAFSKLSPGGPHLKLFTPVCAGNIFPHDVHCPPNHLFLCQDSEITHESFEKSGCCWALQASFSQSGFLMLLSLSLSWIIMLPLRILLSFHNKLVLPWVLVPPAVFCLDVKSWSQHLLMGGVSSWSVSQVHFECIFTDFQVSWRPLMQRLCWRGELKGKSLFPPLIDTCQFTLLSGRI